ncbi:hypothetical protein K7432_011213 [Basidiobolus ranarum]|uniref:Uncharacterized protein n=1 Tax=Basidiobolus ranarum TaxID=34480 RepID=A0ABR2VUA4_9FUNG
MGPKAELIFDISSDLILGSIVAGLVARDVIGITSPQNSSLSIFPKIDTMDAPALVAPYNIFGIQPFAESKKRCPWEQGYTTSDFRKGNIETHCKKQDDLIFIPPLAGPEGDIPDIGNGNNFKSLSDSGYDVQCDHMVELQEILNTLRGLRTSKQQLVIENEALTTELCNDWNSKKFDEKLFDLANSKENTRGAYGTVNNMKRTLMAGQDIQLSNVNANKQVVGTLERYLNDIEVPRQKFSRTLNTKLRDEMISQLTTKGLSLEGLDFAGAVKDNMERAKRGTATLKISVADISRPTNDSNIKATHREPRIGTKRNQKRACAYKDNYNESTDSGSDMDTSL